jgi:SAM-dependent methyltransferase
MNRWHSKPTSWGLGHVDIRRTYSAIDVGCGGGRTIQKVANLADQGRIYGVDYSKPAVAVSRALNRAGIEAGRVDIRLATVSSLPFEDCEFDLVTAVETHYYWPNRTGALLEIRRGCLGGITSAPITCVQISDLTAVHALKTLQMAEN